MFYDDLPIWGFIGRLEPEKAGSQDLRFFIYTHVQFDVYYNGKQIIEIKVRTDPQVAVSPWQCSRGSCCECGSICQAC